MRVNDCMSCKYVCKINTSDYVSCFVFYMFVLMVNIRINTYTHTHTHIYIYIYIYILEHIHIDIHVFTYSLRQLEDAIISFIGFSGSLKGPGHSFH